ncbi:hypothetical protein [Adhaeribacter pallidiroseus]|uniref:Uncharacterized protein n=1 Tax=Adhaeribacter pallidiroseus TaxID=2072847 RepID=A0A369QQX5_9BACT|nr:hypothetical protein [Adhaeribacter pallidiroseus]RDC65637.1 hypothetical protein AHMF7616_04267 [Adhaeribacter pallidiroseus]
MIIERTDNEIILRLPSNIDPIGLQRIINYLQYKEATASSEATEEVANNLADESKKRWWTENKHRFLK